MPKKNLAATAVAFLSLAGLLAVGACSSGAPSGTSRASRASSGSGGSSGSSGGTGSSGSVGSGSSSGSSGSGSGGSNSGSGSSSGSNGSSSGSSSSGSSSASSGPSSSSGSSGGWSDGDGSAAEGGDGSEDGGAPGACGSVYCRGGQTCSAGECVYATCSGVNVPGDYATIQSAVDALQTQGPATICLAAQAFSENVTVNPTSDLTIMGVSASQTSLTSLTVTYFATAPGPSPVTIALAGFTALAPSTVSMGGDDVTSVLDVTNCAFSGGSSSPALQIESSPPSGALTVNITASKMVSGGGYGLYCYDVVDSLNGDYDDSSFTLTLDGDDLGRTYVSGTSTSSAYVVQNCYVHGADTPLDVDWGLLATASGTIVNNTFVGNQGALSSGGNLLFFNNLFDGNQTAIDLGTVLSSTQLGNNALWNNTTNYSSLAAPGPAYVTTNPLLDTSVTPPSLSPGSPCLGAGSAAHAPVSDYWGRPRGGSVNIGAL